MYVYMYVCIIYICMHMERNCLNLEGINTKVKKGNGQLQKGRMDSKNLVEI